MSDEFGNNCNLKENITMAKNERPGEGRVGEIKHRMQVYNPKIDRYVEINTQTHRIINVKSDKQPFKGVRRFRPKV